MISDVNCDESRKPLRPQEGCDPLCSMASCDYLLHDLTAGRLQWSHSASGQEPHPFIFVAAVNNVDAVAGDPVMECGAGVLSNESEEGFPPRVVGIMENLFAKLL